MARPGVARRYGAIDGAFADAKPGQPVTDSACEIHEAPYPQSRSCEIIRLFLNDFAEFASEAVGQNSNAASDLKVAVIVEDLSSEF
jgi:hypothetical protein